MAAGDNFDEAKDMLRRIIGKMDRTGGIHLRESDACLQESCTRGQYLLLQPYCPLTTVIREAFWSVPRNESLRASPLYCLHLHIPETPLCLES